MSAETAESAPLRRNTAFILRFFGAAEISQNGVPIGALPRTALGLLGLLTLERGVGVERASLAAALWPKAEPSRALFYLRRTLSLLRAALGPDGVRLRTPSASLLSFDLSDAFCDVLAFDAVVEQEAESALEEAVKLYRGDLLEGGAEPWILLPRESRARRQVDVLEKLAEFQIKQDNLRAAARLLRTALAAEPLRESNHVRLIEILVRLGDHGGAEWQFQNLRRLLREEINAVPSPATVETYHRLRARPENRREASPPPSATPEESAAHVHLPCPLTALIGRTEEIRAVAIAVDIHRVVTLVGPGGVGKTRLAIAVAEDRARRYVDGVCFVDLAAVQTPSTVGQAISAAVGLRSEADTSPETHLTQHLELKRYLLLLDNAEHVTEPCRALIEVLLAQCPFVHVLVTSHHPLRCTGEQVLPVAPLSLPPATMETATEHLRGLSRYDAIALLIDRASANRQPFRLTTQNAPAVGELCQRLDGLPLALEIAAAQLRRLTPQEVITRLDDAFQALSLPRRERATRHRSLQAMVDWSCERLIPSEQALLARVSVFAGGWTVEMAESVCADLPNGLLPAHTVQGHLDALVEKSLADYTQDAQGRGRYRLLETIRASAAKRLPSEERGQCVTRLTEYCIGLLESARQASTDESFWMERLGEELPNLRVALAWSTASSGDTERGLTLAARLMRFWWLRGYISEGRQWLAAALAAFPEVETANPELAGVAFNAAGVLAVYADDYESGKGYHRKAMEIRHASGDKRGQAVSLHNLGILASQQGDCQEALHLYLGALDIYRALGHRRGEASNLLAVGDAALNLEDLDTAEHYLEQALALFPELEDRVGCTLAYDGLGRVAMCRQHYTKAGVYFRSSLDIKQSLNYDFGVLVTLENIAEMLTRAQRTEEWVRLSGALVTLRDFLQSAGAKTKTEAEDEAQRIAEAHRKLGEKCYMSAWNEGRMMSLAQATDYARYLCDDISPN